MHFIPAQIVRFVDTQQPGWVECEFVDAEDWLHVLRDKVPIFTAELGDSESNYPARGVVPCEVLVRFQDAKGRELTRVSTEKPCTIEPAEGLSEFVVLASLVTSVINAQKKTVPVSAFNSPLHVILCRSFCGSAWSVSKEFLCFLRIVALGVHSRVFFFCSH
jgi:hypothetical protein